MVSSDLLDLVVSRAELESGVNPALVAAHSTTPINLVSQAPAAKGKSPNWTEAEDQYVRDNLGYKTDQEMGEHLGRSAIAVHLHRERDLHLPCPSKHPDYLSANKVAKKIGEDVHKICYLVDSGKLPGEVLPGPRRIRRILKTALVAWLMDPENWIWYDYKKIRDPRLRAQLEAAHAAWGDEWWTSRQVADYHHVTTSDVGRLRKQGKIKGVRATNKGGRNKDAWAFWFFKKSEATRPDLIFVHNKKGKCDDWKTK